MIASHNPEMPLAALAALVQVPVKRLIMLRRLGLLICKDRDGVTCATEADVRRALEWDAEVGGT